jgi:hypothetical protein
MGQWEFLQFNCAACAGFWNNCVAICAGCAGCSAACAAQNRRLRGLLRRVR